MRRCIACGKFYPPSSLLCATCFPAGGTDLATAKALQAQPVEAEHPAQVQAVGPLFIIPAPAYPEWLTRFSYYCVINDNARLAAMAADESLNKLQRDTSLAILCLRRGDPVPNSVDLAAVEAGFNEALLQRDLEVAPA